jgi:hypothetical protein
MASHAWRETVELAVTWEWLLRRVVVEVNMNVHGGYGYGRRGEQ